MSKSVRIWPLPTQIPQTPEGAMRGRVAVMVDLLRASTTIVRALDAGAARVIPCVDKSDAQVMRERLIAEGASPTPRGVLLGGERGGLKIPGFDLANSPSEYTREAVGGRTLVFTTTNGTRAIDAAQSAGAARVLIGCLNNLSAVAGAAAGEASVHIICAGTDGRLSEEDVLCAGAIAERLAAVGFEVSPDEHTGSAMSAWREAGGVSERILAALRESRGGRNLIQIGLGADIADCARIDSCTTVPMLFTDGSLRPARAA